ncbi:hypothetical protein CN934_26805 [Ensifer sp. MMN_5]|nr:hypothetical protein CN934_26805 [Ensifer sp. MMN_5]
MDDRIRIAVDGAVYDLTMPHRATDYIQKKISETGEPYELQMLRDMASRINPGDLVLDIGANVGNHTLYLAAVSKCRVIAFEPNKELSEALQSSVVANSLEGMVEIRQCGVGAISNRAFFKKSAPENLGSQSLQTGSGDIEIITIDSLKLDGPIKVMKIDVEGMEPDVLRGAWETISRDRPAIYAECHDSITYKTVTARLDALGYVYMETFNSTPTLLFVHRDSLTFEELCEQINSRQRANEYRLRARLKLALNPTPPRTQLVKPQQVRIQRNVAQDRQLVVPERFNEYSGLSVNCDDPAKIELYLGPRAEASLRSGKSRLIIGCRKEVNKALLSVGAFSKKVSVSFMSGSPSIQIGNCGGLEIGVTLYGDSYVSIGDNTTCNSADIIAVDSDVVIGRDCMFSHDVILQSCDQHGIIDLSSMEIINKKRGIKIDDHVWLGKGSFVCAGVSIGKGAIAAATATVTKNVPAFSLVAGCPAGIINTNVTWTRHLDEIDDRTKSFMLRNVSSRPDRGDKEA